MRKILLTIAFFLITVISSVADNLPSVTLTMDILDAAGKEQTGITSSYTGSAPITATFYFETKNDEGWTMESYEWRFAHEGESLSEPYMTRFENSPEATFTRAGTDSIALFVIFTRETLNGTDSVKLLADYWGKLGEGEPLTIKATESKLTFPNAFSPNGDGNNDYFGPKECTSIVEFRAMIFTRSGQKIYEWNNASDDGWDGTWNGHPVKEGTYYMYCRAKGADGTVFEYKKDVNLLRTYNKDKSESTGTGSE